MPTFLSNLSLFALVVLKTGFLTGTLPALFLMALVEAKYHRIERWAKKFSRTSSGRAVSPTQRVVIPANFNRATSPPRKAPQKDVA
jgi:hypothetical protein